MKIASNPAQAVLAPDELAPPFIQAEKQASHVGRMMLPAGQTLTLQANIQVASQMPHPQPLQVEPPAAHNVKLLPLTALMPHNGIALGGAILQAIRTLKSEADRKSKEESEPKKKKKKSLKSLVSALMKSAKDKEQEANDEQEYPLKKRRAKRTTSMKR